MPSCQTDSQHINNSSCSASADLRFNYLLFTFSRNIILKNHVFAFKIFQTLVLMNFVNIYAYKNVCAPLKCKKHRLIYDSNSILTLNGTCLFRRNINHIVEKKSRVKVQQKVQSQILTSSRNCLS